MYLKEKYFGDYESKEIDTNNIELEREIVDNKSNTLHEANPANDGPLSGNLNREDNFNHVPFQVNEIS